MRIKAVRDAEDIYLAKIAGSMETGQAADQLDSFMEGDGMEEAAAKAWTALEKQRKPRRIRRPIQLAACLLLALLFMGAAFAGIYNYYLRESATHTDFMQTVVPRQFGYTVAVPDGFWLEEETEQGSGRELYFADSGGEYIVITRYGPEYSGSVNNETILWEEHRISGGHVLHVTEKDGQYTAVWYRDDSMFVLRSSGSLELVIQVAETIKKQ